ncbi:hypothetical protein C8R46DRAFT_1191548 [Mycena filopes]|nr:hypothetical protein C8R46DRAFT_1191548 [Mycena filopes]
MSAEEVTVDEDVDENYDGLDAGQVFNQLSENNPTGDGGIHRDTEDPTVDSPESPWFNLAPPGDCVELQCFGFNGTLYNALKRLTRGMERDLQHVVGMLSDFLGTQTPQNHPTSVAIWHAPELLQHHLSFSPPTEAWSTLVLPESLGSRQSGQGSSCAGVRIAMVLTIVTIAAIRGARRAMSASTPTLSRHNLWDRAPSELGEAA